MSFEPPEKEAGVREQVDAAETRRSDEIAAALAKMVGEEESAALMEDYAERTKVHGVTLLATNDLESIHHKGANKWFKNTL